MRDAPLVRFTVSLALFALTATTAAAQTCSSATPGIPREDSSFVEPDPHPAVRSAAAAYMTSDAAASFDYFNCEVDSFATTPKRNIPAYARPTLTRLRLSTRVRAPARLSSPTSDLDADLTRRLPYPAEPPLAARSAAEASEADDPGGDPDEAIEDRTRPPARPPAPEPKWDRPSDELLAIEATAVKPILTAYLTEHNALYRLDPALLTAELPNLQQTGYSVGRHFRRVEFEQTYTGGLPVFGGKLLVFFDANWNVTSLSRQVITETKLPMLNGQRVTDSAAQAIALAAAFPTGPPVSVMVDTSTLGVDPVRRRFVWEVHIVAEDPADVDTTVRVDADSGTVLNISDNRLAYDDAKLRRWAYTDGNVKQAFQVTSLNQYTRGADTLQYDFFFVATDERGGNPVISCDQGFSMPSTTRKTAYGSTNSSNFIRHTHRGARDFNGWSPAHSSGSFQESHAYYWGRWFMAWYRPTLDLLGKLPANSANFTKALLIANACIDDIGLASSSLPVTTQHNEGEGNYKLRLADLCRAGNGSCTSGDYDDSLSNHYVTCEGDGCHPTPSIMQHELVHFVLGSYLGVGSSLDCGSSDQRKFLHEGYMGSVVPQAYWQSYYGIGYNPPTDRLFTADQTRGRVHATDATKLTVTGLLCSDNTEGLGPYNAGRVVGQAVWEIYHGKKVTGSTIGSTLRPADDNTFLAIASWAADLVDGSTYKDRYEMANRFMEVIIKYGNFDSNAQKQQVKTDWCAIFAHHGLGNYIEPEYCN